MDIPSPSLRFCVASQQGACVYFRGFIDDALQPGRLDAMAKVPSDPVLSAPPSAVANQFVALRVVVIQLAVTLALAGAAYALGGRRAAFSSVVGGVIGVIPTIYLAMRVLRPVTGVSPERQVQAIYAAEAMKFLLTGALFVMAFVLLDVVGLIVIGAYAATTLAYWIALALPGVQAR